MKVRLGFGNVFFILFLWFGFPFLFLILGVMSLSLIGVILGLLLFFLILYFLKNVILLIREDKIKVFNVIKGAFYVSNNEISSIRFHYKSMSTGPNVTVFFDDGNQKASLPSKSMYEFEKILNIFSKEVSLDLFDLELLDSWGITYDGEKFKY